MKIDYNPASKPSAAIHRRALDSLRSGDFCPTLTALQRLARIPADAGIPPEDSAFLEKWLPEGTDVQRGALITALCHLGHSAAAYREIAEGPIARNALLRAAEAQGDADTVAGFLDSPVDVHAALITLRRMGHLEYANALLLSEDQEMVDLVRGLMEC